MNNNFTQLGLGTSVIASLGRSNSFSKIDNIFNTAIDLNIKTIDTSDTYGSGDAERMVGKIIKNRRNETFIVSKVGYPYVSLPEILSPFNQIGKKILQGFRVNKCFKKEYILSGIEKSLKRLNIDSLDAYLLHDFNSKDLSQYNDESFEALYLIKKKGLSNFIGVSSSDYLMLNQIVTNLDLDFIQTRMTFKKKNDLFDKFKSKKIKTIVNSIFNKKIEVNLDYRIDKLLEKFEIPKENKKTILITYCVIKKNIDCALFSTSNINHLKLVNKGFEKYKDNFTELFNNLDGLFE
jgi:pyridoxine 4-dehydrogenase